MFTSRLFKIPPTAVPITCRDIFRLTRKTLFSTKKIVSDEFKDCLYSKYSVKGLATYQSGAISMLSILEAIAKDSKRHNVILPAYTCPTVLLSVKKANLNPVFVDIERSHFCISIEKVLQTLDENTLAVIIPHMFGYSIDIDKLIKYRLNKNFNFFIIEDFCQTFLRPEMHLESRGDFGILSFGRAKCISTINGGAVITFKEQYAEMVDALKNERSGIGLSIIVKAMIFGLAVNPLLYRFAYLILSSKRKKDVFNLIHYSRFDYTNRTQLSKTQLALGKIMMDKVEKFNAIRRKNALYYSHFLYDSTYHQPEEKNVYLRFAVVFKDNQEKERICKILRNRGIILSTADYPVLSTVNNNQATTVDEKYPNASFVASNIINFPTQPRVRIDKLRPLD